MLNKIKSKRVLQDKLIDCERKPNELKRKSIVAKNQQEYDGNEEYYEQHLIIT